MVNPDQTSPVEPVDIEKLTKYVVVGFDPAVGHDVMGVSAGTSLQDLGGLIGVAIVNLANSLATQHNQSK